MKTTTETTKRQRRGHGRPTLYDVATAAGVTRITVSRFMRQPELVAKMTAARIRDAIEQTGYVPNQQAGQLASGNSRIVAALIPNVGHSIFAETIQSLADGLDGSGYELLLLSTRYSLEREEAQLRALTGWAPGAIIVTGRHHSPGALRMLRDAQAAGTPVVEIWDHPKNRAECEGFAQIGFDHVAAGMSMAQHLIGKGHKSLAYVDSGVQEDFRAHERVQGFVAEAKAHGIRVKVLRAPTGDGFDAGRKVVPLLLAVSRARITAVAFANDHLASGALMEATRLGVAVPEQFALLGFGDFPIGRQLQPSLSTVRPPTTEIGSATAKAVLQAVKKLAEPTSLALPYELVARESTGELK